MSQDAYEAGLADIAGEEVVFDPKRYGGGNAKPSVAPRSRRVQR